MPQFKLNSRKTNYFCHHKNQVVELIEMNFFIYSNDHKQVQLNICASLLVLLSSWLSKPIVSVIEWKNKENQWIAYGRQCVDVFVLRRSMEAMRIARIRTNTHTHAHTGHQLRVFAVRYASTTKITQSTKRSTNTSKCSHIFEFAPNWRSHGGHDGKTRNSLANIHRIWYWYASGFWFCWMAIFSVSWKWAQNKYKLIFNSWPIE